MKKSELRTGMIVQLRSRDLCMVLRDGNEMLLAHLGTDRSVEGWNSNESMDDDMCQKDRGWSELDVMKVWSRRCSLQPDLNIVAPIWIRDAPKVMKLAPEEEELNNILSQLGRWAYNNGAEDLAVSYRDGEVMMRKEIEPAGGHRTGSDA